MDDLTIVRSANKMEKGCVIIVPPNYGSVKPKLWLIGMDATASMLSHMSEYEKTRWDVSVELVTKAFEEIKENASKGDIVCLYTFNVSCQVILKRCEVENLPDIGSILRAVKPEQMTNISCTFLFTHLQIKINDGYDIVDIMFTDGIPNKGITNSTLLMKEKKDMYAAVRAFRDVNIFQWCAGISNKADEFIIRSIASSKNAMWTVVDDSNLDEFAGDMGAAIMIGCKCKFVTFDQDESDMVGTSHTYIFKNTVPFLCDEKSISSVEIEDEVVYQVCKGINLMSKSYDLYFTEFDQIDKLKRFIKTLTLDAKHEDTELSRTFNGLVCQLKQQVVDYEKHFEQPTMCRRQFSENRCSMKPLTREKSEHFVKFLKDSIRNKSSNCEDALSEDALCEDALSEDALSIPVLCRNTVDSPPHKQHNSDFILPEISHKDN